MKGIKIRTDGKTATITKQLLLLMSLIFITIPAIAGRRGATASPAIRRMLQIMFVSGIALLTVLSLTVWLLSRYSPIKRLKIRKKIILFTRMFLHAEEDGVFLHCVRWRYSVENEKITVVLYPNGLEKDTADIGRRLSEYLGETLIKYEEHDNMARYIFGQTPQRFDAVEKMSEGMDKVSGHYTPMLSYEPIPIYGGVDWNFKSEALHILLIAPSGAGKTRLLAYLGGMVLKRQHRLYVIDAKNSDFGMLFRHAGVPVATNTEEIIRLLTVLVEEMEKRYSMLLADSSYTDFADMKMQGHILIFDEVLSVLFNADKKDKAEIERLLGQIALKGRAAGFSIVLTAQKLNATDLPKSITEQCQTRIILGANVSEETFHQATGMYKKDTGNIYKGGVGKGYAVTPDTAGACYIETPLFPENMRECLVLLKELRDRGTPYGDGH
ncbi:MAG: FtsK/SpoIIIE domain-containing protein [Clostridium sp.]|nr:FtsK/SpoIIIE domain-containing protein [Clostridium sp.]